MATRARTAPAGGRRPAPLFTVVVGLETFTGPILELCNRTVITPGTAARWLTEADVERIVFDVPVTGDRRRRPRRFFTGALRRAIEVRDRTCFHPCCDEPPQRPEIDHIVEASQGRAHHPANGRLGCGFHNRWRNHHPDEPAPTPADPGRGRRSDLRPRRSASIISAEPRLDTAAVGTSAEPWNVPGKECSSTGTPACMQRERVEDALVAQRVELHRRHVGGRAAREVRGPRRAPRTATRRQRSSPPR